MNNTPETDAAEFPCMTWPSQEHPMVVKADYARKLERERDEARFDLDFRRRLGDLQNQTINNLWRERDEAREALKTGGMLNIIDRAAAIRERDEAREELAAVIEQRDELRRWTSVNGVIDLQCQRDEARGQRDEARKDSIFWQSLADPRFARFGESMWKHITKQGSDFCWSEDSEDILPLAQAAGLCCRVEYDPAIHGEIIEADLGDEIWWWGDFDWMNNQPTEP